MESSRIKQCLIGIGGIAKLLIFLLIVSLLYMAAGMAYGWTAPVMVRLLSNETSVIPMSIEDGSWVVTSIETGDLITPIPAGILADKFGRKYVMLSILPTYLVSWLIHIHTRSVPMLMFARILNGMSMGTLHAVAPLYLSEILVNDIRGKLTAFCLVMWNFGILVSYSIGPYVSYNTLAYIALSLPLVLSFFLIYIPESPYNLIMRNRHKQARKILQKLRGGNNGLIEEEMRMIKNSIDQEIAEKMTYSSLLTNPVCRRSMFLFLIITVVLLFGGLTVVLSYATEIFMSINGVAITPDQCTIILGSIYFVLSFLVMNGVDFFGRRLLLISSTLGCGISQLIVSIYFYLKTRTSIDVSGYSWALVASLAGYCISASIGIMPVTPVYQGEIFPNGIKGIASGIFTLTMCVLSMTALKMFPIINKNYSIYISFAFFSFINLFGCLLMYLYLIETRGKSLVEIQQELKRVTSKKSSTITANASRETVPLQSESCS